MAPLRITFLNLYIKTKPCSKMFLTKKFKENKHYDILPWIGTSKFQIFFISLRFQNLYKLVNVLNKKYETFPWSVRYIFLKFNEFKKMKCDVPRGTTESFFHQKVSSNKRKWLSQILHVQFPYLWFISKSNLKRMQFFTFMWWMQIVNTLICYHIFQSLEFFFIRALIMNIHDRILKTHQKVKSLESS